MSMLAAGGWDFDFFITQNLAKSQDPEAKSQETGARSPKPAASRYFRLYFFV
jgi:hypothetical protein